MPRSRTMRAAASRAAAALTLCAGTLAAPVAVAHDGEALYRERCAKCHSVEKMRDDTAPRLGTDDEMRNRLEMLLLLHHAPDHADHAAIIDYLVKLRASR